MKLKERIFNPYGLRARLGISLAISAVVCVVVYVLLNTGFDYLFKNYYEHSDFERIHVQRQYENFQSFLTTNQIASTDLSKLKEWEHKQPIILLELYADDSCIYSSLYDAPVSSLLLDENREFQNYANITLADREVVAFIYSDFTYQLNSIGTVISIVAALLLFILLFLLNNRKMIRYICRLNEEVQILEGGNLEYCVSEEGNDEITDLARSMNHMRTTLQHQMETEQQLYQANRQLITEMSHDLRTPLTGILLYLEILRSKHYETEAQLQDYLEKIDVKAHHMKILSDHLFEYSMEDVREKQPEPQTMESAFGRILQNMKDDLQIRHFSVETDIRWENCFVQVNEEYIQRIFENLISNIEKYAERMADIRIDTFYSDKYCGFTVMNTFSMSNGLVESNGVGIESIRTMMKQMHGICNVEQTDATFELTLLFPKR